MPTDLRPRNAQCSQYEHRADLTREIWLKTAGELLLAIGVCVAIATAASMAGLNDATPSVQIQPDDDPLFYIGYMP